ncbi:MAG TPA: AgmX/PglI C-terminal domain-containing protein, partial [Bdellovibrionota bacterium]|nr:AgmX/PglI C-terminal domain-containing protein [Bdellovibrionota bacterium]
KPTPTKTPIVNKVLPKPTKSPVTAAIKPDPNKPKPQETRRPERQSKEGQGAKAAQTSGVRGAPNAPKHEIPQNRATRPSTGGTGAGGGASKVPSLGNVDMLKGVAKVNDLLAGATSKLGKGGSRLQGFGGFTSQGGGGLALEGTGQGGGGNAASMGLGKTGMGGGRVGTGAGATGTGNDIIGGRARVVIQSGGPEESVVMGAIDADAVEAAILAHKDEIRNCYERELQSGQQLAGRVGMSFIIGASGRVTQAGVESSSLKNANIENCIVRVIKRIDFPQPRGGGVVQVAFPFKFNSVGN